jgi:hypothetical protein
LATLGAVILRSRILPRALGIIAVTLGAVFFAFGFIGIVAQVQTAVDILSSLQGLWWLGAGIVWLARGGPDATVAPARTTS